MKTNAFIPRVALCAFCSLCLVAETASALDLTPRPGVREGNEGPPTPVIRFSDGTGRIEYQPPMGWRASGGSRAVTFFTPDPSTWMKLMVVDRENPAAPTGAAAQEDLAGGAAKFVPSGAQKLQLIKSVPCPFTIGPHASTEFQFTCVLNGLPLSLSIWVVDFSARERLVIVLAAEPSSFAQVRQQVVTSMFSWSREG